MQRKRAMEWQTPCDQGPAWCFVLVSWWRRKFKEAGGKKEIRWEKQVPVGHGKLVCRAGKRDSVSRQWSQ